jgi:hypothetical protein
MSQARSVQAVGVKLGEPCRHGSMDAGRREVLFIVGPMGMLYGSKANT